jgi:hypothetical protein
MSTEALTETSPELLRALRHHVAMAIRTESVDVQPHHTGGGIMVACIDLSQDGRGIGRQAWLTRDENWMLGIYDYGRDPEDQGLCVGLLLSPTEADDPFAVARTVAGLFRRLNVRLG